MRDIAKDHVVGQPKAAILLKITHLDGGDHALELGSATLDSSGKTHNDKLQTSANQEKFEYDLLVKVKTAAEMAAEMTAEMAADETLQIEEEEGLKSLHLPVSHVLLGTEVDSPEAERSGCLASRRKQTSLHSGLTLTRSDLSYLCGSTVAERRQILNSNQKTPHVLHSNHPKLCVATGLFARIGEGEQPPLRGASACGMTTVELLRQQQDRVNESDLKWLTHV